MRTPADLQNDLFLGVAPSLVVYNHLKEAYSQATSLYDTKGISESLSEKLLKKKDDVITLGVASFTSHRDILEKLYKTGSKTIKTAILTNKFALGPLSTRVLEENLKEIMEDDDLAVAVLINQSFSSSELADFLLHQKLFSSLTKKRWMELLEVALRNPNMALPDSAKYGPEDGWGHYTDGLPHRALTKLLLKLPLEENQGLVTVIVDTLKDLDSLAIPDEEKSKDKTKTKHTDLHALKAILERWPKDEKWDELRTKLAGKGQYHDKDVAEFLSTHSDPVLRCGYYYFFRPIKGSEIAACYKKDGEKFLRAAVNNSTLFNAHEGKPTERAVTFYKLIEEHIEVESKEYQPTIQEEWGWAANSHYRADPTRFLNPNSDLERNEPSVEEYQSSSLSEVLEQLTSTTASARENSPDTNTKIIDLQAQAISQIALLVHKMQNSRDEASLKYLVERNYKLTRWIGIGLLILAFWSFSK